MPMAGQRQPDSHTAAIRATETPAYDAVARLYDLAFADIRVRRSEWAWVCGSLERLPRSPRVLDIGCGTGALLRAMAPAIAEGVGVDVSESMLAQAQEHGTARDKLRFVHATDHLLPFEARRFDVVVSFLSFRYLDWGTILGEVRRVLAPGGRFWLIDLMTAQASARDTPFLLRSALRQAILPLRSPHFTRALSALTSHPGWLAMLARHPIRTQSAYERLLLSEFPGRRLELLDATRRRRVVAFDSGPVWP